MPTGHVSRMFTAIIEMICCRGRAQLQFNEVEVVGSNPGIGPCTKSVSSTKLANT